MSRIIDLDVVAPVTDLTVLIGDDRYLIPGDIPIEDYAALVAAADALDTSEGPEALQAAQTIGDLLLDLFRVRQPDLEQLPVGLKRLVPLIFVLFNEQLDTGERAEVDPPRAEEATAPSGSTRTRSAGSSRSPARKARKRATASRSSSSSAT